jgi:hypothetical protein
LFPAINLPEQEAETSVHFSGFKIGIYWLVPKYQSLKTLGLQVTWKTEMSCQRHTRVAWLLGGEKVLGSYCTVALGGCTMRKIYDCRESNSGHLASSQLFIEFFQWIPKKL